MRSGSGWAERFAAWLLPESQPCTLRVALGIIRVAQLIAPASVVRRRAPQTSWRRPMFGLDRFNREWWVADAARREFEADLAADRRVLDPVRLVWPLVTQAGRLRVANAHERLRALAFGAYHAPVAVVVIIARVLHSMLVATKSERISRTAVAQTIAAVLVMSVATGVVATAKQLEQPWKDQERQTKSLKRS